LPFAPAFLFALAPDPPNLALAMLLLFGSAKLFAEIFERIGQPGIVGEILAGVIIGPPGARLDRS
jgi:Kef-type K+ transport system membrane component KefB